MIYVASTEIDLNSPFITVVDGKIRFLKVGHTEDDPIKRAKNLQTGCPTPIYLVRQYDGDRVEEEWLKSNLAPHNTSGGKEWYFYNDFTADYLKV